MSNSRFRLVALSVLLGLALTACGQYEGVHDRAVGLAGPGGAGVPGDVGGAAGGVTGAGPNLTGPGAANPGATGTGPTGGTTGPGATTPGAGGAGATGPAGPGDRTGITTKQITIGIHAPTTGAAPIPGTAFSIGKDLYWDWLHEIKKQTIHGRTVKVVFRNDDYNPTTAVSVCKQMAENERAFLLIGGAGTDQINACASTYASPRGIPYLSPGVQESGLSGLRNYFAVTMTYRAQMGPLVQLIRKENGGGNLDRYGGVGGGKDGKLTVAHVRPNTPNFNDADQALRQAVSAAGFQYKVYTVVKEGNSTEAKTVAAQAERDGVDVIVPITAPTFTVQLALNADSNGYKPAWRGVAVTNNINAFLDTVCQRTGRNSGLEGATFFSPWPGLKQVMAGKYDPGFREAVKKFVPSNFDMRKNGDLLLAQWGIMRALHQAFLQAGANMSRESFIGTMQSFRLRTNIFPDLAFRPGDPFGAENVHVLRGSCDEQGDGDRVSRGAQYVDHPSYLGLRNSF